MEEFHTDATGIAWVLTGYLISAAIFTPIFGRLGDMFGKRRCSSSPSQSSPPAPQSRPSETASPPSLRAASSRASAAESSLCFRNHP